jgi:hypothetical protein
MRKETPAPNATRWSLIVLAQGSGSERRAALGELLNHYDKFLLWLIRHHGPPPDTSCEELRQAFLERLLERNDIAKLDPARGSFRGWLSLAVRRFLANEWDHWRTAKAGRRDTTSLELEPIDLTTPPDDACTREFARQVILHALRLQKEEARDAKRFDALVRFLPGPQLDPVELAPLARSLGMTQTALAKAICLMRARFRELLREAIGDLLEPGPDSPTPPSSPVAAAVARSSAIDDELRELRRHFWS